MSASPVSPPRRTLRRPSRLPTAAARHPWAARACSLLGPGRLDARQGRASPRPCSKAPSGRASRPAKPSSRGPGPTPGRSPASRCRGCTRARSCSRDRAGRRFGLRAGPCPRRTPAAGEPGTAVYAAHRDTPFRFPGRRAGRGTRSWSRARDGAVLRFRVTGTLGPRAGTASGIDPDAGRPRAGASRPVWPLDAKFSGPLRYLVHAEMVNQTRRGPSASSLSPPNSGLPEFGN